MAVLAVTAVLVATTPAIASYRPTEARTLTAGPLTLQLTVRAVRAHVVDLHLYVFDQTGRPVEVRGVTGQAQLPGSGLGPVTLALTAAGTGHFVESRLLLPRTGKWDVTLETRATEFDDYPCNLTLTVR